MNIEIYQGNNHQLQSSDVNIIIDVLRAFTVAHYAFLSGAKEIRLVDTVEDAFTLKQLCPDVLLAGEVNGLPIVGFDLDNSPRNFINHNLKDKILVQKTTNGVKAALNALNAKEVYVTGFSNARTTASYIKQKWKENMEQVQVNIIASHPTGDDDVACAEYIKRILIGTERPTTEEVKRRIKQSSVAKKFFDPQQVNFDPLDIDYCVQELRSPFVMRINQVKQKPTIERIFV